MGTLLLVYVAPVRQLRTTAGRAQTGSHTGLGANAGPLGFEMPEPRRPLSSPRLSFYTEQGVSRALLSELVLQIGGKCAKHVTTSQGLKAQVLES